MHMSDTGRPWDLYVEDGTVVGEFSEESRIDAETAEAVQAEFFERIERPGVTTALTILRTENPLHGDGLEFVEDAAEAAAANGIERWAVVVDKRIRGMAFDSKLDGLETEIFEDEADARAFLSEG